MARVSSRHKTLAHQVFMMGELHGKDELKKAIAQAIADAEEHGHQVEPILGEDSLPSRLV